MSVAEKLKIQRKGLGKKLLTAVCAVSVAAATMMGVPSTSEAAISVTGDDIIRTAVSYLGTPYVFGGASRAGADCSGFVYAVLTEMGFSNVPRTSGAWLSTPSISYKGQGVNVQTLDASSANYDAKPGDVIVYNGHVAFSMGRAGSWGAYSNVRNYVSALGANTNLIFDEGSGWPVKSEWYRIHARSVQANAEGRIYGIEIDNTNTGSSSNAYAIKAYRFAVSEKAVTSGQTAAVNDSDQPGFVNNAEQTDSVNNKNNLASQSGTPSISGVNFSDVSANGYTVTAKLNNPSGIASISFPTWTSANGQDDITWDSAVIQGDTATYRVNTSAHRGESGIYNTHIHIRDRYGNLVIAGSNVTVTGGGFQNAQSTGAAAPTISNIQISNVTDSGYTITAAVTQPDAIRTIVFPTWTISNGQDDMIWGQPVRNGNTFTYQVKTSEHDAQRGIYATHIHLYDSNGTFTIGEKEVMIP